MDSKEIGIRIKNLRVSKNITQKQISEITNIDATSISRYETGKQLPNLETLVLISTALNTSLDYLVFGNKNSINVERNATSIDEKIFDSLSILLENDVLNYIDNYNEEYVQISSQYSSYMDFIRKYTSLNQFNGLIGKSFLEAKKKLITSFAKILEDQRAPKIDDLPF